MVPVYVSAALSFDIPGQGPKVHSSSFSAWVKSQGSAAGYFNNIYPGWNDKSIAFVIYAYKWLPENLEKSTIRKQDCKYVEEF